LHSIQFILEDCSDVVIVIGSALTSHQADNPFTSGERIEMIHLALGHKGIGRGVYQIVPVADVKIHSVWVAHIESLCPPFDVVYTNEALTSRLFSEKGYEVREIPFYKRRIYAGTEFRRRALKGEDWRELVPEPVAEYLDEHGLVERIRRLNESDKLKADNG
jgi:nicotinamide-nucleotide adenylyltransferase